jgi:hypothetical protein
MPALGVTVNNKSFDEKRYNNNVFSNLEQMRYELSESTYVIIVQLDFDERIGVETGASRRAGQCGPLNLHQF